MFAIWKREWKSYFRNVTGWLFISATLAVFFLYFYVYNMAYGYSNISYPLSAISMVFLITVPILTMKSFADERRNKTDQLLLTAPVSVGKLVWAKYLAMAGVFTVCVVVFSLMPLFMRSFGPVAFAENYVAILSFWLYGLACIAIGTFISSLTENVVISAVLSFVVLFLGFMMSSITGLISSDGNILTMILNCYDLISPMDMMMSGVLDVTGIVYYLSLIALFLFFTIEAIQKRRWNFSSKKIGLGVFNGAMLVMGFALVIVVNLVANALPVNIKNVDLTRQGLFSLTEDTKDYLDQLDEDITIYVLESKTTSDAVLDKTIERFEDYSDHIQVEYKDPDKYPNFYLKYTDDTVTENSLIVEGEKRFRVVDYNDVYQYTADYNTFSYVLSGYDAEGLIDSAIAYVTTDDVPVYYEITGHGETALGGGFLSSIEKGNISLEEINLMDYDEIPEDAVVVIINGPVSDFSADDRDKVLDYIEAGGNLFITTTYTDAEMSNFYQILAEYSVEIVDGMVVELDSGSYYQQPYYVLPDVESSQWTYFLNGYIFAPFAQGMTYQEADDVAITGILSTSEDSISKTNVKEADVSQYEEGDIKGPFSLALYAEKTVDVGSSCAFICSDMSMFEDDADEIVSGTNKQLFVNMISALDDSDTAYTNVMSVAAKSLESETLIAPELVVLLTGILGIIVIPLVILVLGIVVWARRRRR
ncbi:MAG: Gldg family protein [Roseburia sp.]